MWPMPRAPISHTTACVPGGTDRIVSGRPISLLNDSGLAATDSVAPSAAAVKSFVHVLPVEPVMPRNVALSPSPFPRCQKGQRHKGIRHIDHGELRRQLAVDVGVRLDHRARGPGRRRIGDEPVRIEVRHAQGDERVAGGDVTAVGGDAQHPAIRSLAATQVAGEVDGQLGDAPLSHGAPPVGRSPPPAASDASSSRATTRSSKGTVRSANCWPVS